MKTIAMRFADNIAPKDGTILEHEKIIRKLGYVWYGKFGAKVSNKTKLEILASEQKKVLLIHSGTSKRYWLYIEDIIYEKPDISGIPPYYQDISEKIKTWFKVIYIEKADKDVMSKCKVSSSGSPLSEASRASMSPYFIIDYLE